MNRRVGGIIFLKVNGEQFQAKGNFSYNIGVPKRNTVLGADAPHGFSEMPQIPFIEGALTDSDVLNLETLLSFRDVTTTLELANGKTIVLRDSYFVADGTVQTEEGEIEFRMEGIRGEEIPAA